MAESSHSKEEIGNESYEYRTSLPAPALSRNDVNVWSFLKNCIGKEISKMTVPVIYNEPLSFLQRITEYTEYIKLLKIASEQKDPIDRMKYVAGFAVAALASNWGRVRKPFNPLLGETYELQGPDFRIVCEQVSHHPSVSAFNADSDHFTFHGSIWPKLKFLGKSVEVRPKGVVTAELLKWDEAYTWTNVNCVVHNVVVGKIWVEHKGTLEVLNHKLGLRAVITFKAAGRGARDLHKVEGFIIDKNEKKLHFLYGKWTEFIACTDINSYNEYVKSSSTKFQSSVHSSDGSPEKNVSNETSLEMNSLSIQELDDSVPDLADGEIPKCDSTYTMDISNSFTIWKASPRPYNTSQFYQFTQFALSLNEIKPEMKAPNALCPTDSRLRPDIHKLECGDIDGAALEKARLEEKQRQAKKARKAKEVGDYTPRWFTYATNPHTKQDDWLYTGKYWNRKYEASDIF